MRAGKVIIVLLQADCFHAKEENQIIFMDGNSETEKFHIKFKCPEDIAGFG